MSIARAVVALGRKLREDHRIKVRQPLPRLTVVHRDAAVRQMALGATELIRDELNVKELAVEANESAFATVTVKPNFKTLGPRCGPKLKEITAVLKGWGFDEVARLEDNETITVAGEAIGIDDVLLQRSGKGDAAVATDGHVTVALDTTIDDALRREGIAREFTSLMQNARKDAGLEVTDRIAVSWACEDPEVSSALREHGTAIAREILAVDFLNSGGSETVELNRVPVRYTLTKAPGSTAD
jgi:isoleucyl-tRNA synthetase